MRSQQLLKLSERSVSFFTTGILQAERVAGKSVVWFGCEDLFECGYTAFVRHGAVLPQSIIARQRQILKVCPIPR
jgi:hypothetical protein